MTKILGIGNAIVDVLCKIDEAFLEKNNLIKGSMSLIDEVTAQKLSELKPEKITSGGSVGNTIAALSQLGAKSAFLGKVGSDEFGSKFISEIEKTGTVYIGDNSYKKPSAKSFILVTPDAERTMCTFLGCASEVSENDIIEKAFENTAILYLEGYLWDADSTILALKKAITIAKIRGIKIAFSLSDSFCVSRHKKDFLEIIKNDLDILFANEDEITALTDQKNFSSEQSSEFFAQNKKLTAVVTRSEKGCVVFENGKFFETPAQKIEKLIDTTGAGDNFAAGFLYGFVKNWNLRNSAEFGNLLAAKIIRKFGARFEKEEIESIVL
jgi:sugar/nucleoside kinase (ribokinase family)